MGILGVEPPRLVVRSPPQAGESLYGWGVRLAEANGYASARKIFSLVRGRVLLVHHRLARLIDGSPKSCEIYVNKRNAILYHGGELGLGWQYFSARPKVCPSCLAERAILKSVWNLKVWRYCPEHGCSLIDVCPACRKPLARGQRSVLHCGNRSCDANLGEPHRKTVPKRIRSIVGMFGDVAGGRQQTSFPDLPSEFDNLSLQEIVHFVHLLSKPLFLSVDDISEEQAARKSLEIVGGALTSWPHGYHSYLRQLRSVHRYTAKYCQSDLGHLNREFPCLLHDLRYGSCGISHEIRTLLMGELVKHVEENVPRYAADVRSLLTNQPSRLVRLGQGIRELGLSRERVAQAVRKGLIDTTVVSRGGCQRRFVDRDQLIRRLHDLDTENTKAAFKSRQDLVSFADSAAVLLTSRSNVKVLVQAGIIKSLTHCGTTWCKGSSIAQLILALSEAAEPDAGMSGEWIGLGRSTAISSATIADVIQSVLSGILRILGTGNDRSSLRDFRVSRDDLLELFPVVPAGYFGTREAARHPFFSKSYLSMSIRCGLLPSVEHPLKGRMISCVALERFRERFVNAKELVHLYGYGLVQASWSELEGSVARVSGTRGRRGPNIWYRREALQVLGRCSQ